MTNNKNNSASELNDPQGIDRSLLEYLKPKSEDRYSKLEAYCDLLTRATSGTYSTSIVATNWPGSILRFPTTTDVEYVPDVALVSRSQ